MVTERVCVKCGEPIWKGDKWHRNFWKLYCAKHEEEFEVMTDKKCCWCSSRNVVEKEAKLMRANLHCADCNRWTWHDEHGCRNPIWKV